MPRLSIRTLFPLLTAALLSCGCVKHYRYAPDRPPLPDDSAVIPPVALRTGTETSLPGDMALSRGEEGALLPVDTPPLGERTTPERVERAQALERMGHSIQVGAFAKLDNAVRLERLLAARGVEAYYFRHESGLYKVRFGNHGTHQAARREAERLRQARVIDTFYIVAPEEYSAARVATADRGDLRAELVRTARRFIGVPYRWGGTDKEEGFDCSGLTLVCYRLNGLNLPRESRTQFAVGRDVPKGELRPGDLVFFATRGGKRVSHVGMYIGENKFIHAPRTGQDVRIDALSNAFYSRTFLGGKSYF